ncbi:10512_t:CDS:2 [Gigaspora margarita]|uniref:10512_t:CDS:1 n=1 Tax=Gigaspora margarita TaxID=4874 RepID=A0ABN7UQT3_GIGMA|nr:10512_t:CDS:2 [Gigaspora margarita]
MSDLEHSSWEYDKKFKSKTLESEGQREALIQQLACHLPEFEDNEEYEIIEQLPRIYLEYPPSKWDFNEVTTSNESDTSEEELSAFNEYIHWDYCNFL